MNHEINIEFKTNLNEVVEQAEMLLSVAEEMAEIEKESTVFEAELGQGISFKGTKSDFETFIQGLGIMFRLGTTKKF